MKFEQNFTVGLTDIGITNKLTNYGFLSFLEDIAVAHSDTVGYGIKDIPTKHRAWLLMDWKLNVIERPKFGDKVNIKTHSVTIEKTTFHVYRNFEIFNEKSNLIATATSKWVLFDTENLRIVKLDESFNELYHAEGIEKEAEERIQKLKEPAIFENHMEYKVQRRDIDINKHMHNLNYLKLAYEVLPYEVFSGEELNNIHIMYKRQIKLGDIVKCFYTYENEKHIITIKSEDEKTLHAIIELY